MVEIERVHYNKWNRLQEAVEILDSIEAEYTSHNMGTHLIIYHDDEAISYWPSTGKWHVPTTKVGYSSIGQDRFISGLLSYMDIPYKYKGDTDGKGN